MGKSQILRLIEEEFKSNASSEYSDAFIDGFIEVLDNNEDKKDETVVKEILDYMGEIEK